MEENYCVYMHTLKIDERKYIGITKYGNNPNRRWANGAGYYHSGHFYNAIKKYKWDGFKHEILFENLSKNQACLKEQALIKLFQTQDPKYGFNITEGGEHCECTEETKIKLSNAQPNKKNISYDDLYHQYITLGKTIDECAEYFSCGTTTISNRLRLHNICKRYSIPNKNFISKEDLEYQYIILNKSREECSKYFNCSPGKIQQFMKKYNIKKDPKIIATNSSLKHKKCDISYNDLYYQYITLNKTQQECADYFNCTRRIIYLRLKLYELKKEA